MDSNVGARIQEIIKMFKETQDSFSIKTKVSRPTISKWVNGAVEPSYKFLYLIVEAYPSLNAHWLMTGVGSRTLTPSGNEVNEDAAEYAKYSKDNTGETIKLLKGELNKAWQEVEYHKEQVLFMQQLLKK